MNFKTFFLVWVFSLSLHAQTINNISEDIAQQLYVNSDFKNIGDVELKILPMKNLHDNTLTSIAGIKINENLIHDLFVRGYKIVKSDKEPYDCVLISTFTNFKEGMLINSRIIDVNRSLVHSTAKVFVPKKELKEINKIYHKYDWFR